MPEPDDADEVVLIQVTPQVCAWPGCDLHEGGATPETDSSPKDGEKPT